MVPETSVLHYSAQAVNVIAMPFPVKTKSIFWIAFVLLLLGGGYFVSNNIYLSSPVPDDLKSYYVHIPSGSSLNGMARVLTQQGFIKSPESFIYWANKLELKARSGRFRIEKGISVHSLVLFFKEGKQSPINLILNQKRTKEEFAGFVSKWLEIDSVTLVRAFNDKEFLKRYNCTPQNVIALFIPNTYQVYWNYSAQQFLDRMYKESQKFWTEERLNKARRLRLTTKDVITLASIVEKETNKDDEKDMIAGVYHNRLSTKGWRLDADPCVIFALNDYSIRRLTKEHLALDSPYNTYKYGGLPPGPICMPSITTIDETLNARDHDYMFFCAKPDGSGYHTFAKTLAEHKINARNYKVYFETQNPDYFVTDRE